MDWISFKEKEPYPESKIIAIHYKDYIKNEIDHKNFKMGTFSKTFTIHKNKEVPIYIVLEDCRRYRFYSSDMWVYIYNVKELKNE